MKTETFSQDLKSKPCIQDQACFSQQVRYIFDSRHRINDVLMDRYFCLLAVEISFALKFTQLFADTETKTHILSRVRLA